MNCYTQLTSEQRYQIYALKTAGHNQTVKNGEPAPRSALGAMPIHNWNLTLSQLAIFFEGRLDGALDL